MKTQLLTGLFLFALTAFSFSHAQSSLSSGFPGYSTSFETSFPSISGNTGAQECNAKIKGGGADGFPWSIARPFPWSDIQGVWKLRDGVNPFYLKAKVIRTTSNRKILSLSVITEGNCAKPIAQGLGYVDFSERNVVRAIMNDGIAKYQIKIASFDVRDLEMDAYTCGEESVVAASIQPIGSIRSSNRLGLRSTEGMTENVLLKKTTEDIATICRKLDR